MKYAITFCQHYKGLPRLQPFRVCKVMKDVGLHEEDYDIYFGKNYEPDSKHYFAFYDMRYAGKSLNGFHDIQKIVDGADASIGYYTLATILNYSSM